MKVSVVMPVYNGEKYIEYAIKSIINQSYQNIQFILVDGGSNDNTMMIVEKYKEYFYLIISEKDNGMYDAINKGFLKSDGEIMLWLNSDDYLFPEAIKTAVEVFEKNSNVRWLTGRNVYIDSFNHIRKIYCFKSYYKSLIENGYHKPSAFGSIMQETTFWHRELYNKAGSYINTNYKLASDYELWLRFAKFETLYSVNTLFGAFRQHLAQLSSDKDAYEKECAQMTSYKMPNTILRVIKYPLYIYSMLDKKNKINIDLSGNFEYTRFLAIFQ